MKKTILSMLLLLLPAAAPRAQLLWEVTGGGLEKPSYVVGTYHLAQAAFADSVAGLNEALAACGQVYCEVDLTDAMTDLGAMQAMQQSMMMPQGMTLDSLLTPAQLERLNAAMRSCIGADLSNPLLAALGQMKPAALSAALEVAMCAAKEKGFDMQNQFELHLLQEAQRQHKKTGGLETMEFQTSLLYEGKSLERQAEELMCLIDHSDYSSDILDRTIAAYYSQNLQAIEAVTQEKTQSRCDATPEEENALIYDRNAAWAKALPALMQADATLVAVGAAHLPGERGLLSLLQKAGYTLRPVRPREAGDKE